MNEAANEIDRLTLQCERLAVKNDILETRLEVAQQRIHLTDAEREAVDTAEASLMRESTDLNASKLVRQRLGAAAATLRGLLERTNAN